MQWHGHVGGIRYQWEITSAVPSEGDPPKADPLPRHCPVTIPSASVSHWGSSSQHESLMDTLKPRPRHITCSQQGSQSALGVESFLSFLLCTFLFSYFQILHLLSNTISHSQVSSLQSHDTPNTQANLRIASKWAVSVRTVRILSSSKIQQDQLRWTPTILLGTQ